MNGEKYLKLTESIHMIPGINLDPGVLCGTNCYVIGTGKNRFIIDACKKDHQIFLDNVKDFVQKESVCFEAIFITHGHYDHMEGAYNLISLMQEIYGFTPKVYKFMDGSWAEERCLEVNPGLENHIQHLQEGQMFTLDNGNI